MHRVGVRPLVPHCPPHLGHCHFCCEVFNNTHQSLLGLFQSYQVSLDCISHYVFGLIELLCQRWVLVCISILASVNSVISLPNCSKDIQIGVNANSVASRAIKIIIFFICSTSLCKPTILCPVVLICPVICWNFASNYACSNL